MYIVHFYVTAFVNGRSLNQILSLKEYKELKTPKQTDRPCCGDKIVFCVKLIVHLIIDLIIVPFKGVVGSSQAGAYVRPIIPPCSHLGNLP